MRERVDTSMYTQCYVRAFEAKFLSWDEREGLSEIIKCRSEDEGKKCRSENGERECRLEDGRVWRVCKCVRWVNLCVCVRVRVRM